MVREIGQPDKAASLFEGWEETLIWSCLQGVMGKIYGDREENPRSAMAVLGDFCFLAGEPKEELVLYKPEQGARDFVIMVPRNETWAKIIEECFGDRARRVTRYAIKKEADIFDHAALQRAAESLPQGFTMKMMGEELFYRCRETGWCRDFVAQYDDYEMYRKYGMGAVILKEGEPVSGASSYSGYRGGIEIEIDTREEYRRQGLAYACGAKLVLECGKRGWYPSWDAQNLWSAALAEKLGYHFDHEYPAYEVRRS